MRLLTRISYISYILYPASVLFQAIKKKYLHKELPETEFVYRKVAKMSEY